MIRALTLALLTLLPAVAFAQGDSRLFVHVESPDRTVSLPLEWTDDAVLADLGITGVALEALRTHAEALKTEPVGARAEWTAGAHTFALEQRPDTRVAVRDVQLALDGMALIDAEPELPKE